MGKQASTHRQFCIGQCGRVVSGHIVACPICYRRLPAGVQAALKKGSLYKTISKHDMKLALKAASAYLASHPAKENH